MMVEKYKIRTDLAMEQKERFESDHVEVSGVVLEEEYDEEKEIKITTVRLKRKMGRRRWETCGNISDTGSAEYGSCR